MYGSKMRIWRVSLVHFSSRGISSSEIRQLALRSRSEQLVESVSTGKAMLLQRERSLARLMGPS